MLLGVELPEAQISLPNATEIGEISARFWFKSTLRTQEIQLVEAEYKLGTLEYRATKESTGQGYKVTNKRASVTARFFREAGFLLEQDYKSRGKYERNREFLAFRVIQKVIQQELLRTQYLGPFRQAPRRRYPTRGVSPTEVGPEGESAITLLANETVQTSKRAHIKQIAAWLSKLRLAKSLDVTRLARSDLFDVSLTLQDDKTFPIADLGYGLSQVLPVLTQCVFAPEGATLLFEQPELHLHSLAARSLASVFLETMNRGITLVLETHSPDLLRGFQQELRAGRLTTDEIAVYRISRKDGGTVIKELELDENGDIYQNWEKGLSVE